MENIQFIDEDVEIPSFLNEDTKSWLNNLSRLYNSSINHISYIFVSDEFLLDINRTYLQHDDYTDIITFPYKQGKEIESDIFISVDRVKENAETFEVSYEKEMLRVMAHGLLHLTGLKDKSVEEEKAMRKAEDEALAMII